MELPSRRDGGPGRVLYWFRTPPGVRVGGTPLDEETRRLIETRHPEIRFDWRQLLSGRPSAADPPSSPARAQAQLSSPAALDGASRRRRRDRRGTPPPAAATRPDPVVESRSSDESSTDAPAERPASHE
jgi:hypothetical protein